MSQAAYPDPVWAFAELATTYDARLAGDPLLSLESTATLAALPPLAGLRMADFGCGTGRYALQLARDAAHVIGIDACPEMLDIARKKAWRQDLPFSGVVGDLCGTVPLPPDSFDAGVCALTLAYVPDVRSAFLEMARLLRPGSSLVVSDRHPHGLFAAQAAALARNDKAPAPFLRFTSADGQECRIRQYPRTVSDLWTTANDAGFVFEQIAEPVVDRRLASTYANLREQIGVPLALILRFRKT